MPDFGNEAFRLVFILKEGNDPTGSWCAREGGDLREAWDWPHTDRRTWNQLARYAAIVFSEIAVEDVDTSLSERHTSSLLRRICAVNLKKEPGSARAMKGDISRAAVRDATFLKEQLALYQPSLTICCGSFASLQGALGMSDHERFGFKHWDDGDQHFLITPFGIAMDFWHPLASDCSMHLRAKKLSINLDWLRSKGLITTG
jgi:hypothetical protein